MGLIRHLQDEHREWVNRNFPGETKYGPLLGMTEELGELAHAHLKHEQKIRGMINPTVANAAKADALGDLFIYAMSYCNQNDLDLETCIEEAWDEVRTRDWIAFPINGIDV